MGTVERLCWGGHTLLDALIPPHSLFPAHRPQISTGNFLSFIRSTLGRWMVTSNLGSTGGQAQGQRVVIPRTANTAWMAGGGQDLLPTVGSHLPVPVYRIPQR